MADALTGGSAADSPQCQLYTVAEVAKYMGEPVTAGANAAGGTGCMWRARTKAGGNMLVQVVPARYHPASGGQRHPALADIGTQGFVREELGGWIAGAIVGDESIVVSVTSSRARESTAIELLKETLKRRTK